MTDKIKCRIGVDYNLWFFPRFWTYGHNPLRYLRKAPGYVPIGVNSLAVFIQEQYQKVT